MPGCLSAGLTLSQDSTGLVSAKGPAAATEQGAGMAGHTGSRHRSAPSANASSSAGLPPGFKTGGSPGKVTRAKLMARRLRMEQEPHLSDR